MTRIKQLDKAPWATDAGKAPTRAEPGTPPSVLETVWLLVRVMRPAQWPKNLIAYAPLLFAGRLHDLPLFLAATNCVVAFCLISSGLYVLNDVVDASADRAHPAKRHRPVASGRLNAGLALAIAAAAVAGGLALALSVRPTLFLVSLAYLIVSSGYSTVLKHKAVLDVFAIAAGFVLRAVAGAVAVAVPASGWFLVCTSLGALFLALEKRRQELILLGESSSTHRRALGGYSITLLDRLEGVVAPSLLTSYAFYSFLSSHGQWMLLTVPFVLYGLMRYQVLSVQSAITGAPETVLWKDRPIQITICLWVVTCALVVYGVPDMAGTYLAQLDSLTM